MVVGSIVRPRVIEAAIRLFGLHGYAGVNMRNLAKAAKTTTGTVYRLFDDKKEKLYEVAVTTARSRAMEAVARSVFVLVDNTDKDDALAMIGQALRLWYSGLGQAEARVLLQVEIADSKHRQMARDPFEKMTLHLGNALQKARPGSKLDMHKIARALLDALFLLKVSEHGKSEKQEIENMVDQFVLLVGSK